VSRLCLALPALVVFTPTASPAQPPEAPATAPKTTEAQPAAEKPAAEAQLNKPEKPAAERKLKFNFRFQRWADVLEWFAQQSDLSLVLDAPPPGTFNYTDNREYTPTEAIDLLNGVLLSKGYTLLRRDRMLLVVNLADGLPADAVPRVQLDELDRRGKYEFVSVLFPLGKRSADEVNKEIAPLLGPHGKSVPLVKTAQLLVTDTAGVMRAIHAIIESIPEPAQAAAPPTPQPAEKPQLVVYPIKSADPGTALEVLRALLPDAKFALDSKTDQINALAAPSQQPVIKSVLEQMQSSNPPDKQPRLAVYTVHDANPQQLVTTLQPIAPGARLSADAQAGKLAVWGTPREQETIQKALSELDRGTSPETTRRLEIYRLTKADPATALALLQVLLPGSRLAIDSQTRSLVALATPAEHKSIQATLDQLQPEKPGPDAPELRFYRLEEAPPASLTSMLQTLTPKAQITVDTNGQRLMVLASPTDHTVISATLDRVAEAAVAPEQRVIGVYPLKTADTANFMQLLEPTLQQRARIVPDAKRDVLIVWAVAKDQQAIQTALAEFQKKLPGGHERESRVYRLRTVEPSTALAVLTPLVPGAQMTADAPTRSVIALATPADHKTIVATLEQLQPDKPGPDAPELRFYSLAEAPPANLLTVLQTLAPKAQVSFDTTGRRLMVLASPTDHTAIAATVDRVEHAVAPPEQRVVAVYPLKTADSANFLQLLDPALQLRARLVPDAKREVLIVWAAANDQETIKKALDEFQKKLPAGQERVSRVYHFRSADPSTALSVLGPLVPGAQMAVDPRTRSLVITAMPDDHTKIKSSIGEIDREDIGGDAPVLKVHHIESADPAALLATLQSLFAARPEVRLSLDPKNDQVIAMASPSQHSTIATVIKEVEKGVPADSGAKLEVYPLGGADPANALQVLNTLLTKQAAKVRLSVDTRSRQLVAIAPPEEQATIRSTIERLQTAEPALDVFQLQVVEPYAAENAIDKLFATEGGVKRADAPRVESDVATRQLFVRATKEQLTQIRDLLVKMGETNLVRQQTGRAIRVIPFHGDAEAALSEIHRVWPQLRTNPVRVVTPSALLPTLRGRVPRQPGSSSTPPPAVPSPEAKPPEAKQPDSDAAKKSTDEQCAAELPEAVLNTEFWHVLCATASSSSRVFPFVALLDKPAVAPEVGVESTINDVRISVDDEGCPGDEKQSEAANEGIAIQPPVPVENAGTPPPTEQPRLPVVISVGDDTITIASDDAEALDEMEALVRTLAQRGGVAGGEFTVYLLKFASAPTVSKLVTDLYKSDLFSVRNRGAVVAVPDERLNAVVVHASRADRSAIENLLKVLDSPDVPDMLIGNKPRRIAVKHMRAAHIEQVIRDIYKAQLSSGGGRTPIAVPSGASAETAAVIQQINATASGAVMSVSVEDATNSIVVMAPATLGNEIAQLVESLDTAAIDDPSRSVRLVQLKKTNAMRVQQTLDVLIKDALKRQRGTSASAR